MTYNQLGFALIGLRTLSFATIDSAHKKKESANLTTSLGFGLDEKKHSVHCTTKFEFEHQKNQPFLILEVQALFEIDKNDFESKMKQQNASYLITKEFAIHFAVLTIGAARGILHTKTENTLYNQYLLPTINVVKMVPEDIVLGEN